MRLPIRDLRAATERLYTFLEQTEGDAVEVPDVHYWSIPAALRQDPYREPTEFTIGQTSEDVRELQRIAEGVAAPFSVGLVWLAAVLREIGDAQGG
jgi:hypothetical protein